MILTKREILESRIGQIRWLDDRFHPFRRDRLRARNKRHEPYGRYMWERYVRYVGRDRRFRRPMPW
jgi:hypothetical protein